MREETKTTSMMGASFGIVLAVVASHGCRSAEAQATKPDVDPKADALLRKMSTTLANTPSFSFDADHVLEVVKTNGEKLQFVAQSRVALERPNKLRSDRIGPVADLTFRYDGTHVSVFGNRTKMYAISEAPSTIDEMIDFARDTLGLEAPGADLLYKGAYYGLMEDVVSGSYVGLEPVGDRMCHHLAYRGTETDWQIWVDDTDKALPCRYVITTKNVPGAPEFQVSMTDWKLDRKFDPSFFAFTPPKDGTKIEFLALAQQREQAVQKRQGRQP